MGKIVLLGTVPNRKMEVKMKFKHLAILFATLFLPACSDETKNNNNDVARLETEKIQNICY